MNEQPTETETEDSASHGLFLRGSIGVWFFVIAPLTVWLIATAVRVTIRDRVPYAAAVFYATPLPLLTVLAVAITLRIRRLGWMRSSRFVAVVGTIQLMTWLAVAFRSDRPEPPDASLRAVFWNVSRGDFGYEEVARQIAAFDADIVTMTEAIDRGQSADFWQSACPGYSALPLSSGMTLLVRGEASLIEHDRAGPVCRWRVADVTVRGVRLKVGVVDFTSNPLLFRGPGFDALGTLFERHRDEPFILAGDFNTPVDSALLGPVHQHASNAFEQSGEGFRETWPVFVPLLTLDQVWGNSQINWHRCRHLWSLHSDHRPVVAEFEIRSPANVSP